MSEPHDDQCESEFIFGPMAHTPCACASRLGPRLGPSLGSPVEVDGVLYTQRALRELIHERHRMALEITQLRARLDRADRHLRLRTSALIRLIAQKGPRLDAETPRRGW